MPNVFKHFSRAKAEPYRFPDAQELQDEDEAFVELGDDLTDQPEELEEQPPEEEAPPEPETPVDYAQIQADMILKDARQQAEEILEKARLDAELQVEQVHAAAREAGRQEGYAEGLAQAQKEAAQELERRADLQEGEVQKFLDRAGTMLDRQLDEAVDDLRDLALAIAEKVVCVSLRSSGDVITRMIQTAIDKRKRREWVHIYIAECDAKRLVQIPASLTAALSALSDRVRIIPMADDESGTCIIEMPDEIIDASAATQLNNIRSLLMDTPSGGTVSNLLF